jgi:hypothetical protein
MLSGSYCIPRSEQTRPAVQRSGEYCPMGYFTTPNYCTKFP